MGLIFKKTFLHDKTYQIQHEECYVRIENYLIRKNPAFLELTVRYWESKEIADSNNRSLYTKPSGLVGVLDPYLLIDEEFVKFPSRFTIPLISKKDEIEDYDINVITDVLTQSYEFLKIELQKEFSDLIIEDL